MQWGLSLREKLVMQIQGTTQNHGPQQINAPHTATSAQPTGGTQSGAQVDQLDISHEADMASRIREIPDIRQERIAQIRAEIEAGTYETENRLSAALDNLLDEIG
jgi:negative regulator of flagellin synthesis FlgM